MIYTNICTYINIIFFLEIAVVSYEPDEKIKEKKYGPLVEETVPYFLDKFDSIAKANDGHLACGKVCNFFSRYLYCKIRTNYFFQLYISCAMQITRNSSFI